MNNYDWLTPRRRRRNLFIVEGNHEKNKLMGLLLKIYPEIDIEWDDIIIYATNIYQLYEMIKKKYNDNWYDTDVDLPFIVGEKLKLDDTYAQRCISVSLHQGDEYKNLVKDTAIAHLMDLPRKMKAILLDRFKIEDERRCSECVEQMLLMHSDKEDILIQIREILHSALTEPDLLTAQFQMKDLIDKSKYVSLGKTYYEYMRSVFKEIIIHNIRKGNWIQGNEYKCTVYSRL